MLGPLRLLLKTKAGQRKSTFDWEWIAELMSHSQDMMQDELMRRHLSDIVGVFEDLGLLGDGAEASCSDDARTICLSMMPCSATAASKMNHNSTSTADSRHTRHPTSDNSSTTSRVRPHSRQY